MKHYFYLASALVLALVTSCSTPTVSLNQLNQIQGVGETQVDGYTAVDLGLMVRWAGYNVGAKSPEQYGKYFAWGEVKQKLDFADYNSDWFGVTLDTLRARGVVDAWRNLTPAHDPATVNWGSKWRMPTAAEVNELHNACSSQWMIYRGAPGRLFTSRKNGRSIFLPAAGYRYRADIVEGNENGYYMWRASNELGDGGTGYAFYLNFNKQVPFNPGYGSIYFGRTVRAVTEY